MGSIPTYSTTKNKQNEGELSAGRELSRNERLKQRSKEIGTRHTRKLRKYSDNFNLMFTFFLQSNRKNIINFCGSSIEVEFDIKGVSGKECFRLFEDGYYKTKPIITRHPNIVKGVLTGKKGWGLWRQQWSEGIAEHSFTKEEILSQFLNIKIPESLIKEFDDFILKEKVKRY